MDFNALLEALNAYPPLRSAVDYDALTMYMDLVRLLKPTLTLIKPSYQEGPPDALPVGVHDFLRVSIGVEDETAKLMWIAFRDFAWRTNSSEDEERVWRASARVKYMRVFLENGLSRGVGIYDVGPPTRICLDPACRQQVRVNPDWLRERELVEPLSHPITVFTADFGAIPSFTTSMYCRGCHSRYHPNYYVHIGATRRTYYSREILERCEFLHVAKHHFFSVNLCELITNMLGTCTSASNIVRVYSEGIGNTSFRDALPASPSTSLQLTVQLALDAFFLNALLHDHAEQGTVLELPHDAASQALRLQPALQARNARMAGPGQEEWSHACDSCCWVYTDNNGVLQYLRSTVTDGVTLGHPCCGVQDCTTPLASVNDHFCPNHRDRLRVCVVTSCEARVEPGFRTCPDPSHRALELYHYEQGKSMFQLKRRHERTKALRLHDPLPTVSQPLPNRLPSYNELRDELHASPLDLRPAETNNESINQEADGEDGTGIDDDELLVDADGICDGKPEAGNEKVRARFGRRRTHNEELCVGSCGMVLGRGTFFGSEAPNGVRTFWKRLFPTKESLPGVLWYDNNCQIIKMLNNDPPDEREYFGNVALPVDVFHFKCKHKESDEVCGLYCNPYNWQELRTEDDKAWRFNSSAAEQTNAWFGGFSSIVREMQVARYNFFLDEMIKRRNRLIKKDLERRGKAPWNIPRDSLLRSCTIT
ncbi:hypothetical protein PLICRDRAFT_134020 [Plicaturopsis crispa FD-325 SS-3]|nr:hypothetical protein PLICRDRAFT_134020 [Plicaturopsis crispa FD-325 SS-3]